MAYLHHLLVNFPIALSLTAAFFVVLSWLRPAGPWAATARAIAYLAAVGGVGAAVTGLFAASHVIELGGDAEAVARHRSVALPAAIFLVVAAVVTWGSSSSQSERGRKVAGALSIFAAIAVGFGAHLGGDMLHPGLAPWSQAEHRHGPGIPSASGGHHGTSGDTMPPGHDMPRSSSSGEPMPPAHDMPEPSASALAGGFPVATPAFDRHFDSVLRAESFDGDPAFPASASCANAGAADSHHDASQHPACVAARCGT